MTPEETYLWQLANRWRQPVAPAGAVNWPRLVEIAIHNRMQLLLHDMRQATGASDLDEATAASLQAAVHKYRHQSHYLGFHLRRFMAQAAALGLPYVIIKGLWVAEKVYGRGDIRPGADIDILVRRRDMKRTLLLLEYKMGYGRWWRPLLDDRYYARHHLHQQRANPGREVWFEPHWAFDHPYTRLTIDYEAMLDRSTPGELYGYPVRELALPDLILSLAIHLVKHAVYLPACLQRADLPRLILADGMMMYFVDVAEVIKRQPAAIDWAALVTLARTSGAADIMGAVLHVCQRYLQTPVPVDVLSALPVTRPGIISRTLMQGMAEQRLAGYLGQPPNRVWAFLVGYNPAIVFRPIRLLDFAHYLFPGRDYLRRRYGRAGTTTQGWHLLRAIRQYARVGLDTAYYTWQRNRRLATLTPAELARFDARYVDPLPPEEPDAA